MYDDPASLFVLNKRLTPMGYELIRLIDRHIGRGKQVTVDLRHYVAMVYRTHWLKPIDWLEQYPEKAMAVWVFFHPEVSPNLPDDQGD